MSYTIFDHKSGWNQAKAEDLYQQALLDYASTNMSITNTSFINNTVTNNTGGLYLQATSPLTGIGLAPYQGTSITMPTTTQFPQQTFITTGTTYTTYDHEAARKEAEKRVEEVSQEQVIIDLYKSLRGKIYKVWTLVVGVVFNIHVTNITDGISHQINRPSEVSLCGQETILCSLFDRIEARLTKQENIDLVGSYIEDEAA